MEQINAIVDCDVARLDAPLRPWKARQGHNFVALFRRVPADVTAHEHPDGGWTVRIPAACFPEAGEFRYEVHALAADDQPAAIGEGRLAVASFSTTTTPAVIGEVQEVAQLPCAGGGFVQVVMKWDGYEWMPEAVHSATANEGTEEP